MKNDKVQQESLLFFERVLHATKALPEGSYGHIYQKPENTYRKTALTHSINYKETISTSSRSINQQHYSRTLRDRKSVV